LRMTAQACRLSAAQRRLVEETIVAHCTLRRWVLHAVSCRTNHVHVVVSAGAHPDRIRDQLNLQGVAIEDTPEGTIWKVR